MGKYAVIEDGNVVNIINWDGTSDHPNKDNFVLADSNTYIGGTWNGSAFSVKPTPEDTRTYAQKREGAYPSVAEFLEAYTEKEIGGDTTKWDAYVAAYNQVRTDYPKPE